QRPVTRVRVDDELRVGQMLAESVRVDCGDHDVVISIGHKYRLRNLLQVGVWFASGLLPGRHRCELCARCLRGGWSVRIFPPPRKSLDKLTSSRLASFSGFEEQFE